MSNVNVLLNIFYYKMLSRVTYYRDLYHCLFVFSWITWIISVWHETLCYYYIFTFFLKIWSPSDHIRANRNFFRELPFSIWMFKFKRSYDDYVSDHKITYQHTEVFELLHWTLLLLTKTHNSTPLQFCTYKAAVL